MKNYCRKYQLLLLLCVLISCECIPQERYIIVADSPKDSLFCSVHCPFYDFDWQETLICSTLPDQLVTYRYGSMDDIIDATKLILLSSFEYAPNGLPISLYVVIDSFGTVRGIIVNTTKDNELPVLVARVAFNYLKTKEFYPASLRAKPITYGFFVLFRTIEKNYSDIVSSIESWPKLNNDDDYLELASFVKSNLKYEDTITSTHTIIVSFHVDTLGKTSNHKVIRSDNHFFDSEALRVCQLIKFDHPAIYNSKPINVGFTIPITFTPKTPPVSKKRTCCFGRKKNQRF